MIISEKKKMKLINCPGIRGENRKNELGNFRNFKALEFPRELRVIERVDKLLCKLKENKDTLNIEEQLDAIIYDLYGLIDSEKDTVEKFVEYQRKQ